MSRLDSLFCEPLSEADHDELQSRLLGSRAEQLSGQMASAQQLAARLEAGGDQLRQFFLETLALAEERPERFREIVSHWAPGFLIGRLMQGIPGADRQQRVVSHLLGLVAGRGLDLAEDLPRVPSWGIPIFERIEELGMREILPAADDPGYLGYQDFRPLTLAESLEGAHRLLQEIWPAEIAWAKVLVPAFVDLGGPPSPVVHRSETYGANSPIFLSKADVPLTHAMDVVHELQHIRLNLLLPATAFGGWNDRRQRFISPYRKDPRPSRGLVLGLHAFVAVNEVGLRAARSAGFTEGLAKSMFQTHRMNLFTFRTLLEHEELEEPGRRLLSEIAAALAAQHAEIEAAAPAGSPAKLDQGMRKHCATVKANAVELGTGELLNAGEEYFDWDGIARLAEDFARQAVAARG